MAKKPKPAAPAADQPYYLQRAHIKDFRSIRDAAVEFKPGLNIIIGPNGSGKTNLVRCTEDAININSKAIPGSKECEFLLTGKTEINVAYIRNSDITSYKNNQNLLANNLIKTITTLTFKNKTLVGSSLNSILLDNTSILSENIPDIYGIQLLPIHHGIPNSYGIIDKANDFTISNNGIFSQITNTDFYPTSFVAAQLSLSILLNTRTREAPLNTDITKAIVTIVINRWLQSLAPILRTFSPIQDIRLRKNIQSYESDIRRDITIKGLSLEFKINKEWIPFDALSSGTQRIFYILSEVTAESSLKLANLPEQDEHPYSKIILLEEPELGIHPHQLHLLLNFLREQSEKHQLIITTHSPQVLDMLREDELDRITICELHKTKGTLFRKLKKTQLADAKRYMREVGFLSDYWRMGDLEAAK